MIPILYGSVDVLFVNEDDEVFVDENGQAFTQREMRDDYDTLGVGMLGETISCIVTEVRNGKYELFMTYPVSGRRFQDIKEGAVIKATPSKGRTPDYFRIYSVTKPLNGIIEIHAEHVSYQLSHIPVMPFTAGSVSAALLGLVSHSAENNPFTFWTDKSTTATYTQKVPASCRSRLGGVQGSILDVYGGEFEFDRYDVKLWASRGADNGVQLRYGKNITDLTQETNIANTITGVCPFWADDDGTCITLPEEVIYSPVANHYPFKRTVVKDFSQDFENAPTVDQLRAKAQSYISQSGIGLPEVSIEVSFVDLSDTADYSDIALLETVKLCDTVTVIFEPFDINTKAKVVETEWNVLKNRYESITLGTVRTNLASIVASNERDLNQSVEDTRSILASEIQHATDMITGADGGYIVINRDADGNPTELLVMNTPDITTATRVWRWNQNGLGVSNNGYNGPYETAMTADGHITADFVTAGTLQGITLIGVVGLIGGWTLAANELFNEGTYDTTGWDSLLLAKITSVINGTRTQAWGLENGCDIDGSGVVDIADLAIVTNKLLGTLSITSGDFRASSSITNPFNVWNITDTNDKVMTQIGVQGFFGNSATLESGLAIGQTTAGNRVILNSSGLSFYDANGNLTKSYSAT